MNECMVSIIMPTYNRGYIIKNAIRSVQEQTNPNWELIIVDDASNDNTEEIINAIADSRIVYIRNQENKGANYSRNRGCTVAKGKFLAFLDSDNVWRENMLERQLGILLSSEDIIAFSFCKQEVINKKIHIFPSVTFDVGNLEETLRRGNVVDTNTVVLKKEVFEAVGGFDNDMPRMQDWELFFRIIVVYHYKAIFVPEVLDKNIVQSNSISNDNYRYQVALNKFLEKHYKYFTQEEIWGHLISLGRSIKEEGGTGTYINNFFRREEDDLGCLFAVLAQHIYSQYRYYDALLNWKENMEKNRARTIFSDYAVNGSVIALYGLGRWGELIYSEMSNCGFKIEFGIDKKVEEFHGMKIVKIDEIPKSVDVIIVSIFQEFARVHQELSRHFGGRIISIEELVYDKLRNGEE